MGSEEVRRSNRDAVIIDRESLSEGGIDAFRNVVNRYKEKQDAFALRDAVLDWEGVEVIFCVGTISVLYHLGNFVICLIGYR